ncbi:MAG: hypothetical protein PHI63_05705 [Patescibacteria group bacterium]|nr:hypothetical protein [Patescibacteria group bacterium]
MWFLADAAGSSGSNGIIGLIAIAVIVLVVCGCKLACHGMLAFVRWMLPQPPQHKERL